VEAGPITAAECLEAQRRFLAFRMPEQRDGGNLGRQFSWGFATANFSPRQCLQEGVGMLHVATGQGWPRFTSLHYECGRLKGAELLAAGWPARMVRALALHWQAVGLRGLRRAGLADQDILRIAVCGAPEGEEFRE